MGRYLPEGEISDGITYEVPMASILRPAAPLIAIYTEVVSESVPAGHDPNS